MVSLLKNVDEPNIYYPLKKNELLYFFSLKYIYFLKIKIRVPLFRL